MLDAVVVGLSGELYFDASANVIFSRCVGDSMPLDVILTVTFVGVFSPTELSADALETTFFGEVGGVRLEATLQVVLEGDNEVVIG